LLDLARKSLNLWFSLVKNDNTVVLPDNPESLGASCPNQLEGS
jgi:hypothetical protein